MVALVAYAPQWNFTDLWILIAIAGYLATFITGVGVLGQRPCAAMFSAPAPGP